MVKLEGRISTKRLYGQIYRVPSSGGGGPLQAKTAYPKHSEQIIIPDEDYYGLVSVTVKPTPRLPACVASVTASGDVEALEIGVNNAAVVDVFDEEITFSYNVVSVDGASYGFGSGAYYESESGQIGANPSAYYTSQNKGWPSSYAMCKIVFNSASERNVVLNCVNYAESNYDYGIISEIDTMLDLSDSDDGATGTEKVIKNFKGQSSADVVSVPLTIPAGEHFVCVKFRKDSGGDQNNDTLKFAIEVQ